MWHLFIKPTRNQCQTAGSILLLLAVSIYLGACQDNKPEEIKALTTGEDLPSLQVQKLESVITDSGMVKYRFITPLMLQFDNSNPPYTEFPKGLHLVVYNRNHKIDAQIKCNYAIFWKDKELWDLQNDVEAVNVKNEVINTEQLFWDSKAHTIYSDEFIKITTATDILTGYGFESDEEFQDYKIKRISGIVELQEEPGKEPQQ